VVELPPASAGLTEPPAGSSRAPSGDPGVPHKRRAAPPNRGMGEAAQRASKLNYPKEDGLNLLQFNRLVKVKTRLSNSSTTARSYWRARSASSVGLPARRSLTSSRAISRSTMLNSSR